MQHISIRGNVTSWNITLTTMDSLTGKRTGRQVLSREDALKYLNDNNAIFKNELTYKDFKNLLNLCFIIYCLPHIT